MKSINKINGFCANNQTIQFYQELRRNNYDYNKPQNYRNRYFRINERIDGKGEFSSKPLSNMIYYACDKEFERFLGVSYYKLQDKHEHLKIESKHFDIQIQIVLSIEFDGVYIKAVNFERYKWLPDGKIKVKSNQSFFEIDFLKYFETKILPKYLYAPGFLRDIQLQNNCTKEKAKEIYKHFTVECQTPQNKHIIENNKEKAIRRNLRRHFNLICDGFWNSKCMLDFRREYGKQSRKTWVESHPNVSYLLSDFDGDIDELESEYWDLYERTKPTIFV